MKTLQWLYFCIRLKFISVKLSTYYFLYDLKDKLYNNVINDMDSLNDYADGILGR